MLRLLILAIICLTASPADAQPYERKTNLPHIYIDTYDHVGVKSKTTYVKGVMHRVDTADAVQTIDSLNIRGRGNSTWNMAKKPYRLKFNKKEKFLGKGKANAKSWTLIANHGDKTMMRNALTQLMGTWVGLKRCPAHEFVDLTLDGSYRGTYMVSDHVEVRPHRVNVEEQDYPLTDASDISGGYLFEFDGFNDGNGFRTSRAGSYIRIHYPDEDDIAYEQNNYARQYFSEIERRLYASNFTDPIEGYRAIMDTTSLINWYLATEICANIDGFFSTYCYKYQGDDHLFWGPLWDYDIAYANDHRKGDTTRKLMRNDAYSGSQAWVQRMWQDEWFQQATGRRYQQLYNNGLDSFMLAQIDSMAILLDASQRLNFEKWGISTRAYNERVLYSTYDEYVRDLRNFVPAHNAFLATQFVVKEEEVVQPEEPDEPQEPEDPTFTLPEGFYCRIANVKTGTVFDSENYHVCGWSVNGTRPSQLWDIQTTADGYYRLFDAESGLALNDPNEGIGAQLVLGAADDEYSLWNIMPQNEGVNLINVGTGNCANLSGGSSNDGTSILSYTSDAKNATSANRRWFITATATPLPEVEEPEEPEEPTEPEVEEPEEPDEPTEPEVEEPEEPEEPTDPEVEEPEEPEEPTEPEVEEPEEPEEPTEPEVEEPEEPEEPTEPEVEEPEEPEEPTEPEVEEPEEPEEPTEPEVEEPEEPEEPTEPEVEEPEEPEEPDVVAVAEVDYALAYDPVTHELHFGSNQDLGITARVFLAGSRQVGLFRSSTRFNMSALPSGLYIVTWQYAGRRHSIKFIHTR